LAVSGIDKILWCVAGGIPTVTIVGIVVLSVCITISISFYAIFPAFSTSTTAGIRQRKLPLEFYRHLCNYIIAVIF
jgi:hypothetical protein